MQAPLTEVTDANGTARIFIDPSREDQPARLIVEAQGYKKYLQNIDLMKGVLPTIIQLEPSQSPTTPASNPQAAATIKSSVAETSTPVVLVSNSSDFSLNKTLESDIPNFSSTLTKVEFRDSGHMRWYIDFWNQTDKDYRLAFYLEQSYIVDENGHRYKVLSHNTGEPIGFYQETIQVGVKVSQWFEFESPQNGAKNFKLTFVGLGYGDTPDFQPIEIKLDY